MINLSGARCIGDMRLTSHGHSRDISPFLRGKNIFYFVAMVNSCCVIGCKNRKTKGTKFTFHCIPKVAWFSLLLV